MSSKAIRQAFLSRNFLWQCFRFHSFGIRQSHKPFFAQLLLQQLLLHTSQKRTRSKWSQFRAKFATKYSNHSKWNCQSKEFINYNQNTSRGATSKQKRWKKTEKASRNHRRQAWTRFERSAQIWPQQTRKVGTNIPKTRGRGGRKKRKEARDKGFF